MLYLKQSCSLCGDGTLGLRHCDAVPQLVVVCDECHAVWLDPAQTDAARALIVEAPLFRVPGHSCSIARGASRWATRQQVEAAGWGRFVAGEARALGDPR